MNKPSDLPATSSPGAQAPCKRCGVPCRVAARHNPDARLLEYASEPDGFCPSCAATAFLRDTEPLGELIEQQGPECLRLDHIREQFAAIMRVGRSDAHPDEIDWDRVIRHWDLPFPPKKRGQKKGGRRG